MVASRDPKPIFERLLRRLLDGMVVPFIGAGVSIDAKHRGCIANLTNTISMRERVKLLLLEKCRTKEGQHCDSCVVHKEIERVQENGQEKDISFDKICELWEWSCPGERGGGTSRRCELVREILKIPEFANVEPADAYYYLAFLARERLIDEVITTNYDTCIEEAYCNTFGFNKVPGGDDSPAVVIRDLSEYRANGGKRFTEGKDKRRCLKVYKINGCANMLRTKCGNNCGKNNECQEYCNNILLTEKDLQDWGKRSWARDLFRDRLHSRALLFSGFGSDEPQVRHTALQVCEEFASEERNTATNRSRDFDEKEIWENPNAPFVVAYESTLSFSQTQIMRAYASYEGVSLSPEETNKNVFLGSDVCFFDAGGSSGGQRLPANLFWKRLFQAAFWRLLRRTCGRESAVVSFFLPVLPCAFALLNEALDWFIYRNGEEDMIRKMLGGVATAWPSIELEPHDLGAIINSFESERRSQQVSDNYAGLLAAMAAALRERSDDPIGKWLDERISDVRRLMAGSDINGS